MGFNDTQTGPCEKCGEPGELVADPYAADVHGVTKFVYLCGGCFDLVCDEI